MVRNDGGDGDAVQFHSLDAHAYADAATMGAGSVVASYLETGKSDATWIFPAWEGVLAARAGQSLNLFTLGDHGDVRLLADPPRAPEHARRRRRGAHARRLAATAAGYAKAAADPGGGGRRAVRVRLHRRSPTAPSPRLPPRRSPPSTSRPTGVGPMELRAVECVCGLPLGVEHPRRPGEGADPARESMRRRCSPRWCRERLIFE